LVLATISISLVASKCGKQEGETAPVEPGAGLTGDDPVWVRVNGNEIRKSEIEDEMRVMEAQIKSQYGGAIPSERFAMLEPMIKRRALEGAVEKRLIEEVIEKEGIEVDPKMVDEEFNRIKSQYPDEAIFMQKLIEQQITEDDLRENISQVLRYQAFFDIKAPVPEPTEEEILEIYEASKSQLMEPPLVTGAHIVLMVPTSASEEARKEKRAKAEEARKRLLAGEDMAALVQEYSDSPTKANGGVESFVQGQMPEPFDSAVFGLKQGEISEVIESPVGFHIVRADEVVAERVTPLEKVRDEIVAHIEGRQKGPMIQEYLKGLMAQSEIEYIEPLPEPSMPPGPGAPAPAPESEQPPAGSGGKPTGEAVGK
jgi:peptidyl-prolyl cis-trans isomerase C